MTSLEEKLLVLLEFGTDIDSLSEKYLVSKEELLKLKKDNSGGYLTKNTLFCFLPQYKYSENNQQRYFDSIGDSNTPIKRSDVYKFYNGVSVEELKNDCLDYFNSKDFPKIYKSLLTKNIEAERVDLYFETLSDHWYEENFEDENLLALMASIYNYLFIYNNKNEIDDSILKHYQWDIGCPMFNNHEIDFILKTNYEYLSNELENWANILSSKYDLGSPNIFFSRGVKCSDELLSKFVEHPYKFKSLITSFTLSHSVAEKFSFSDEKNPTILHIDHFYLKKKSLFFSPFISGMNVDEFELGLIPFFPRPQFRFQGFISGRNEFILDNGVDALHEFLEMIFPDKDEELFRGIYRGIGVDY